MSTFTWLNIEDLKSWVITIKNKDYHIMFWSFNEEYFYTDSLLVGIDFSAVK